MSFYLKRKFSYFRLFLLLMLTACFQLTSSVSVFKKYLTKISSKICSLNSPEKNISLEILTSFWQKKKDFKKSIFARPHVKKKAITRIAVACVFFFFRFFSFLTLLLKIVHMLDDAGIEAKKHTHMGMIF